MTDNKTNNKSSWKDNLNTKDAKIYSIGSIASSLGNIFNTQSLSRQAKTVRQQMIENAKYQADEVSNIMGRNAISYLKRGVGMSGSALEVIRQVGENGYENIANNVDYTAQELKDKFRGLRNQAIISVVGTLTSIGANTYGNGGSSGSGN